METGSFQVNVAPVLFSHVVRDALSVMRPYSQADNTKVDITCVVDPMLADQLLLIDGKRIQQVLANVLSNAIKFSPHDGSGAVQLTAQLVDQDHIDQLGVHWAVKPVSEDGVANMLQRSNSYRPPVLQNGYTAVEDIVLIRIKDQGPGIAADEIPLLFQPFRQVKAGLTVTDRGTGLGLSIVLEIVELHGGKVGVKSTAVRGEGSEFFITLCVPLLQKVEPPGGLVDMGIINIHSPHASGEPVAIGGNATETVVLYDVLNILIVDDVASNRKLLRRLIEVNFKKRFADNGYFTTADGTLHVRIGKITFVEAEDGNIALAEALGDASLASNDEVRGFGFTSSLQKTALV